MAGVGMRSRPSSVTLGRLCGITPGKCSSIFSITFVALIGAPTKCQGYCKDLIEVTAKE